MDNNTVALTGIANFAALAPGAHVGVWSGRAIMIAALPTVSIATVVDARRPVNVIVIVDGGGDVTVEMA